MDNFTAQAEELEALKAIYEDDLKIDEENGSHCVTIKTGDDSGLFAQFEFMFPDDYPSQSPPVFEIKCIHLAVDDVREVSTTIETMFSKGEVVLYQWIEWIREYLESKAPRPIPDNEQLASTAQTTENTSPSTRDAPQKNISHDRSHTIVYLDPPEWVHGEPITDRRSTFQAHAAVVRTTEEVEIGLTLLKENKKIASATHNILAYRLQDPRKRALVQDCDDDGETAAGGRLLHLLQIMDVMNVMVVITRWYGGIQLGPDRFKHINNAARILLQETKIGKDGGAMDSKVKKKSKSSRSKK